MLRLLVEAIVVGVLTAVLGTLTNAIVGPFFKVKLPPVCDDWNQNYVMQISLFFTGVVIHLFCELVGINRWYCRNGYACLQKK